MTTMLVTAEYVAASTGADVSDSERVDFLIGEASQLVMDSLGRTYTPETAPVAVKQAVSVLVAGALGGEDGESPEEIRAEQVGDYRVEYGGTGKYAPGLDIRRVEHLLVGIRSGSKAVVTDVPMDGLNEFLTADPLAGALVVNR